VNDWVRPVGEGSRGAIVAHARGDTRASRRPAGRELPAVLPVDATVGARTAGRDSHLSSVLPVDATVGTCAAAVLRERATPTHMVSGSRA
jgi:hypothetical protein